MQLVGVGDLGRGAKHLGGRAVLAVREGNRALHQIGLEVFPSDTKQEVNLGEDLWIGLGPFRGGDHLTDIFNSFVMITLGAFGIAEAGKIFGGKKKDEEELG